MYVCGCNFKSCFEPFTSTKNRFFQTSHAQFVSTENQTNNVQIELFASYQLSSKSSLAKIFSLDVIYFYANILNINIL